MLRVAQLDLKVLAEELRLTYLMSTCVKQFSQSFPSHKDHGDV